MFKWIDYEGNSALFINGAPTNVAILRHKDFQLHDNVTGNKTKMKSSCLDEARLMQKIFSKHIGKILIRN